MKITIITVYNSHNYGSFLQAKQLFHVLSEYGDVWFYNSYSRKLTITFLRKVKKIITTRINLIDTVRGAIFEFNEMFALKRCWNSLPSYDEKINTDIVCMGSDEIWNIARRACCYSTYWGMGFDAYKISYAPSINNTEEIDFARMPDYVDYMQAIDNISVRDIHSKNIISKLSGKNIEIVLDPTLLDTPEDVGFYYKKPYVAVYLFYGSLTQEEQKRIVDFARSRNFDLISAGQYITWCDHCVHSINGNPFYIYNKAEYVITNTFHGTAYAINYNKKFVALVKEKIKVVDMLEQFDLSDRIVQKPEDVEQILNTDIDYSHVNQILEQRRATSKQFIKEAIERYKR